MARYPGAEQVDDVGKVRAAMDRCFPDPQERRLALELVADSIEIANAVNPRSWAATFPTGRDIGLTVAWQRTELLSNGELFVALHLPSLSNDLKAFVDTEMSSSRSGHWVGVGSQTPEAYGAVIPAGRVAELLPKVRSTVEDHVRFLAGSVRTQTHSHEWHTPAVLDYLRDELGRHLPSPEYADNQADIAKLVSNLLPDLQSRQLCLEQLADSVERVNAVSTVNWCLSTTKEVKHLRLNVGRAKAFSLDGNNKVWMAIDASAVEEDDALRNLVETRMRDGYDLGQCFPSTPTLYGVMFSADLAEEFLPRLQQAYIRYLDEAAQISLRGDWHKSHNPAAIAYLRRELDRPNLPDRGHGGPDQANTANANWWIEQTTVQGYAYRESGKWSMGRALFNHADLIEPPKPTSHLRPGDVVLHFRDREAFVGLSRVDGDWTLITPEPDWDWNTDKVAYVPLTDFTPLDPPLARDEFFTEPFNSRLETLYRAGSKNLFFQLSPKPGPHGGAYLTAVPPALYDVLHEAYCVATGKDLAPEGWPVPAGATAHTCTVEPQPDPLTRLADRTHLPASDLRELREILDDKRQVVLEGPPGSGKTWVAGLLARWVAGVPIDADDDQTEGRVETVQFHQSYGYEDFVQGIRPVTAGEALGYRVVPGIFTEMCRRAEADPAHDYVLVIDEINRGNLSRIFGELLMLLEYRDRRVRLPHADADGDGYLRIPRNLHLIGTMNSTDRSLAMIDYALRRRFAFWRMLPVSGGSAPVLERWLAKQPGISPAEHDRVRDWFLRVNHEVMGRLGPDYQVGHSYVMRSGIGQPGMLERIWRREVRPLLEEYFHAAKGREELIDHLRPDALAPAAGPVVGADDEAEG